MLECKVNSITRKHFMASYLEHNLEPTKSDRIDVDLIHDQGMGVNDFYTPYMLLCYYISDVFIHIINIYFR